VALVLLVKARRGTFLYCPHGPLLDWSNSEQLKVLQDNLLKLAKEHGAAFIRLSPVAENSEQNRGLLASLGYKPAPIHMSSEFTWITDISGAEEEVLRAMKKVARNNINRSKREEVAVSISINADKLSSFIDQYHKFAAKKQFVPFSKKYLQQEFKTYAQNNRIALFTATFQDEILAQALIVFYGKRAFYHHSYSTGEHPKKQASYAMLWEAIIEAKRRGCTVFNFWGIAPPDAKNHPWQGLTFFKQSFGGGLKAYIHAHDYVISRLSYTQTWIVETIRKKKRHL